MNESLLFLFLVFLLSVCRGQIANLIQGVSLLLFNSGWPGIIFYSLMFLPGILIHELSHLLTAELLGVRTGKINIFPSEIEKGKIKMGYVESEATDPFRETLIGSAPFVSGLLIITVIGLTPFLRLEAEFLNFFFIYLVFAVSNTMFVSEEDKRGWWFIPVVFLILMAFFYSFRLQLNIEQILNNISKILNYVNKSLILSLFLDLLFLFPLLVIRRVLERVTGKYLQPIKS